MKDLSTILIEETIAEIKYLQEHQHDMRAAEKASRADTILAYLRLIEKAELTTAFNRMAKVIGEIDAEKVAADMRGRSCPGCTSLTLAKASHKVLKDRLAKALVFSDKKEELSPSNFISMTLYFEAVANELIGVDMEELKKIIKYEKMK